MLLFLVRESFFDSAVGITPGVYNEFIKISRIFSILLSTPTLMMSKYCDSET